MRACWWLILAGGCAFKYDPGDDFFPLVGDPPVLEQQPHVTGSGYLEEVYRAPDGRLWVPEYVYRPPVVTVNLHSLEPRSQTLMLPANALLLAEGVMTAVATDEMQTRYHVELAVPGQAPFLTRDITLPYSQNPPPIARGPGYFLVWDPRFPSRLLYDDGGEDSFDPGDSGWQPWGLDRSGLGRRFILLLGVFDSNVGVYDLAAHAVRRLGPMPMQVIVQLGTLPRFAQLYAFFDDARGQLWMGGDHSYFSDLAAGSWVDLQLATLDMRLLSDGGVLLHDASGTLSAVAAGGARRRVGFVDVLDLKASHELEFVYSRPGYDDYDSGAFGGWLGDQQIIRAGLSERFSADGTRLYWMEDAAKNNSAGDLYSLEIGGGRVRHLARNVKSYSFLPDGRLVAIAHAALDGPWNRAIVIDEARGESRWLGDDLQSLTVVGDQVVGVRRHGDGHTLFLLAVPPR
jgi:hypothetical protein